MPHLAFSERAKYDLFRLFWFLRKADPPAAKKAAAIIDRELKLLTVHPRVGRPITDSPETRELVIPFGKAAYCALYTIEGDNVVVRALRHSREAGY